MIHFKIVVPVYNASPWIERCLASIQKQSHANFECIVIDDASTDATFDIACKAADKRFTIMRRGRNWGPLANTWDGFRRLGVEKDAESVLTVVDGDDWLAHAGALARVAKSYDANRALLLTYGNYANDVSPTVGQCGRFSPETIAARDFRRDANACISCLRTFKAKIWNRINVDDLKDPQTGDFFAAGGDVAYLMPLLDLAGNRFEFIEDILYYYTTTNPLSDYRIRGLEQIRVDRLVRNKPKYPPFAG